MWGSGSIFPLVLKINIGWRFSCSLLTTAAIIPRDAASDTPLVGGREGHRSRLDALEN